MLQLSLYVFYCFWSFLDFLLFFVLFSFQINLFLAFLGYTLNLLGFTLSLQLFLVPGPWDQRAHDFPPDPPAPGTFGLYSVKKLNSTRRRVGTFPLV